MNRQEAGKLGQLKTKDLHKKRFAEMVINYNNNPSCCNLCSKALPYEKRRNKFCNHSCSAIFINLKKTGGNFKHGDYVIEPHPCLCCGKIINTRKKRQHCSSKCSVQIRWIKTKNKIEQIGEITCNHTYNAKKYLIEVKGYCCSICELSEWLDQKLPLVLDHIDGNSNNWKLSNLRLLCSNCDSLTPTYKGKNIGNGRHSRRLRYAEGKSY